MTMGTRAPRAVILAAGLGSRIRHQAAGLPKPLVPVRGRALISYTLDALASCGLEEAVVVTGHAGDRVHRALSEGVPIPVRFETNPCYESGAASSLRAARDKCGDDPFLLLMSDHLLEDALLQRLLAEAHTEGATIAADHARHTADYEAEATRLAIDQESRRVTAIGKGIIPWHALDTGAFYCTPDVWGAVDAVPPDAELSAVFGMLASQSRLYVADVTGAFWYDVDTPDDLAAVEALMEQRLRPGA